MVAFIDDHRQDYGVEPICEVLQFAPSTYYAVRAHTPSARQVRDTQLKAVIRRVWDDNFGVYGYRKLWHALRREGHAVARCTVARLMRELGLAGAVRGKAFKRTTVSDKGAPCALDRVNRDFKVARPNALWVADFT